MRGLTLQDFDFYEIHEAFAAQVLCTLKAWESPEFCRDRLGLDRPLGAIDRSRLNVKGSSLAVGHPFAATGARIVATLAKLLEQRGSGRGLISICTAGGMGVTAILERQTLLYNRRLVLAAGIPCHASQSCRGGHSRHVHASCMLGCATPPSGN